MDALPDWKRGWDAWASFGITEVARKRKLKHGQTAGEQAEASTTHHERSAAPQPASSRIFISYRRHDCQAQANGLMADLRWRGAEVFMDLDSIPPGTNFEEYIRNWIANADLVLVLIGDNWLDADTAGRRRLDRADDFVRLEIRAAIEQGKSIIPVLVEGAEMPPPDDLPDDISDLSRIQSFELSDRRWMSDLGRLAEVVLGSG